MLHQNNNKTAVKKIAKRMSQTNRVRNIFAVLAIVLTTYMISTIFSIGINFVENYNVMMTRMTGTAATIFLKNPTEDQLNAITDLDDLEAVGVQIRVGDVSQETVYGDQAEISVYYADESEWENHQKPALHNIHGRYPQKSNEVMLSVDALEQLGITIPEEGMEIPLNIASEKGETTETFQLSGWFTSYGSVGRAFVSESYTVDKGLSFSNNGMLSMSTNFWNKAKAYEKLKEGVPLKSGQEFIANFDVSEESSKTALATALVVVILALFVVLSGYLLIYNVMYISVSKDIRFYGMLKTIGTSPKQIRKIVSQQLYRLSLFGIPLGLILSSLTLLVIVPLALSLVQDNINNDSMPEKVSYNPLIFVGTALFAFLTVFLGCRKPAKIASSISPIEALKYTGIETAGRGKKKGSTKGGKLHRLALYNVFREKKRAVLVFASLFMGVMTLLSINVFLGSLKVANYLDTYYPHDFSYQASNIGDKIFDEPFMAELSEIEGITNMNVISAMRSGVIFDEELFKPLLESDHQRWMSEVPFEDFIESLKSSDYGTYLFEIDESNVEAYNESHETQIDLEAFRNGDIIIVDNSLEYESMEALMGEKITLIEPTTNEEKTVPIGGIFGRDDVAFGGLYSYQVGEISAIYVSETFMNRFTDHAAVAFIDIDVERSMEPAVNTQLSQLNEHLNPEKFYFTAKSEVTSDFASELLTINILASGVSILLIFIGILNFINVMLTGVHNRRQELAVMESIGMTKKQIRKMLTYEGLYYAVITTLLILTVGNGVLYGISELSQEIANYAIFYYPTFLVTVIIATLFVICLAVPRIVYQVTSKESITERLHEIEG